MESQKHTFGNHRYEFERFNPCDLETPISPFYVIYRFVHLCWYIISYAINYSCHDSSWSFYAIYLTHQTLFLQAIYSGLYFTYIFLKLWSTALTPAIIRIRASTYTATFHVENNRIPLLAKIIWILMNIIFTVPYIISLVYWFFLHSYEEESQWERCKVIRNHCIHTFNSVVAVIDSLVVSVPIKFTHGIFPMLDAFWYCFFSLTYEFSGGPYPHNDTSVYSILYWKHPDGPAGALKASLGSMCGGFLAFVILCWGGYRLKSMGTGLIKIGPLHIHPPPPHDSEAPDGHDKLIAESERSLLGLDSAEDHGRRHSFTSASSGASSSAASSVSDPDHSLNIKNKIINSRSVPADRDHHQHHNIKNVKK